jgi:hypothetical protein
MNSTRSKLIILYFVQLLNSNIYRVKQLANEKKENGDSSGFVYDLHEKMREIVSTYNDTMKGRCAVCLEQFQSEQDSQDQGFTDRFDLARINECYHRFHLICVHRDWFMPRKCEKDEYGGIIEYSIPEIKKCPICRREVSEDEIKYIT